MKITMNHEKISHIATDTYLCSGDLSSNQELIIEIPQNTFLVIEGNVKASGSIVVKGGNLIADGNITSGGSILCDGELCTREGSIFAITGIKSGKLIAAMSDVCCAEGDIVASIMRCRTFNCQNYDECLEFTNVFERQPEEDIGEWLDKTATTLASEIIAQ